LASFDVIRDILNGGSDDTVTVHADKKIKRKKRGRTGEGCVSVVIEPEDRIYRVSFLRTDVYGTIHQCLSAIHKSVNVVGDHSWMTI
jgi:hypothetical protein